MQSQLSEDLRRQVVSEYQRRFQEIQLNTRKGPIEETQTREFHMYHSVQPRTQLSKGAPRIEEGEILRKNQHQRAQQTVEKESTDKLTSYGQIRDQKHNKSTRIQEANISTASITSNSSEISRAMEKISETNHLIAQQQIAQQRVLQALLLQQEQSNENQEIVQRVQT